jgi:hypothetical protein
MPKYRACPWQRPWLTDFCLRLWSRPRDPSLSGCSRPSGQCCHNSRVVERGVESAERGDRAPHHLLYLGDVAGYGDRFVTRDNQLLSFRSHRILLEIDPHDRSACLAVNACAAASPVPDVAPVTSATLFSKILFTSRTSFTTADVFTTRWH